MAVSGGGISALGTDSEARDLVGRARENHLDEITQARVPSTYIDGECVYSADG